MRSHIFYCTAVTSGLSLHSKCEKGCTKSRSWPVFLCRSAGLTVNLQPRGRSVFSVGGLKGHYLITFLFQHLWSGKVKHMVLKLSWFMSTWAVVHKKKLTSLKIIHFYVHTIGCKSPKKINVKNFFLKRSPFRFQPGIQIKLKTKRHKVEEPL